MRDQAQSGQARFRNAFEKLTYISETVSLIHKRPSLLDSDALSIVIETNPINVSGNCGTWRMLRERYHEKLSCCNSVVAGLMVLIFNVCLESNS